MPSARQSVTLATVVPGRNGRRPTLVPRCRPSSFATDPALTWPFTGVPEYSARQTWLPTHLARHCAIPSLVSAPQRTDQCMRPAGNHVWAKHQDAR